MDAWCRTLGGPRVTAHAFVEGVENVGKSGGLLRECLFHRED